MIFSKHQTPVLSSCVCMYVCMLYVCVCVSETRHDSIVQAVLEFKMLLPHLLGITGFCHQTYLLLLLM